MEPVKSLGIERETQQPQLEIMPDVWNAVLEVEEMIMQILLSWWNYEMPNYVSDDKEPVLNNDDLITAQDLVQFTA